MDDHFLPRQLVDDGIRLRPRPLAIVQRACRSIDGAAGDLRIEEAFKALYITA